MCKLYSLNRSREEAGQASRDNFVPIRFFAQHADGGLRKLAKARVVAVIFGFPSFVFNELSWNPSQWFDVKISFLEKSSF